MGLQNRIKRRNFTDERLNQLLISLSGSKSKFWNAVAKRLTTPRNNRAAVNLNKLDRFTKPGLTLVVPGKVLSVGNLSVKTSIAALSFSQGAAKKIADSGGRIMTLEELFGDNPEGLKAKMVI